MTVQCMLSSQRRSVLSRFLESTTFHGIPLLWNSQTRFEKVTYLLAFLISTAFTLYSITPVVTEYIEKPIGTSYVIESVFKLPLPAVSICPFGRFYRPYLKAKNISSDLLDYIEMAFMVGNVDSGLLNYSKLIEEQLRNPEKWESELNAALSRLSLTFDQFIEEASLSCRDLMTNCKNYTDYSMDCCDGSKRIITSGGPCFTLNMSPQVDGNGLGYGQTISVRLNATNISESNNVALNEGILVKLSEPGLGIDFPTIFAPAGAHTLLQLKAVISQVQSTIS